MDMQGSERIEAPVETVWRALNDPEILKQAIPGCESLDKISDTHMTAKVVLKIGPITRFFQWLGKGMEHIEHFSREGAAFVYGGLIAQQPDGSMANYFGGGFVFAFNITATIILVCILVAILYHYGIMQRVVSVIAKGMNFIMRVSGAEALSNVASAFVGQVEAQVMIRPYLPTMTKSEPYMPNCARA